MTDFLIVVRLGVEPFVASTPEPDCYGIDDGIPMKKDTVYWRLGFEMLYCKAKSTNRTFWKQHCIFVPLVAQEIGSQVSHESIWHTPKTEDFFSKGIGLSPFPSM